MIRVLCREFGMLWALGLCAATFGVGVMLKGDVVKVPVLDRGFPGSWLAASGAALLAWYLLRPRWQREVVQLVRARLHRAVLVTVVATMVIVATLPLLVHSVDSYELMLYPLLFAMAVVGAIAAGNLGWVPILVVSVAVQSANNLSLMAVARWVNLHADQVLFVGAVMLLGSLFLYVSRGPIAGFPSAEE